MLDLTTEPEQAQITGPLGTLPIPLTLDRSAPTPLHAQLAGQVRAAALAGTLPAGTVLPGSRSLAAALGVTRGVVTAAFETLLLDGTLEARPGSGTRVAPGVAEGNTRDGTGDLPHWLPLPTPAPLDGPITAPGLHFRAGVAGTRVLDLRAWRAAWAAAARNVPDGDYGDPAGEPELRAALAAFVGRARGLRAEAGRVVVTAGSLSALGLIARLLPPGSRVLAENPGYRAARQVLQDAGLEVLPVPVDADGLVTENLPPARLVVVTPSHQYPLGVRMSLPRRLALLRWARAHDALIVEDDYDGEFRYGAPPLPPLAGLEGAQDRVLYLGTLSKLLTPAVRSGFLVAPPALVPALVRARALADGGHDRVTQAALTHFLKGGHLDRHVRRAGRWHAQQQAVLARALAPLAPDAVLGGIEAGLHACLHLPSRLPAGEVTATLAGRGVHVSTLTPYTFEGAAPNALLLGYGGLTVAQIERGAREIVRVVRAGL
ncbi:PLP-dependent aminotransferase family protein [Deinococcus metallilatus]|uniref:GntR family transcriptional regulator/MocR family aminotransferase n=1 Tax=Deinococcus metallilatus TaxID=1211322 RepID=A0AAJ5F2R7_9DEIO|nr:PLP-dependent aminotransferase family protein [Deinococcus metallilatus]MBB5296552.1 GntR family transcriptional regulator/MocR family aminotransferase [Deinococcus metallilatus]QBY08420.1 PLP-dependent aminotransferase family protein [Deinococcus metallilatus]RXJ11219.1 PLP-dependent aminotransferase family protein [Deinococcus metallilatus]TLK24710.1 PLP-dependent aminotransferase family protein [Deinococcus metallilatus]GMA17470.1 GntR family transcriptional regulator [Deinococcus metall